MFCNNAHLLDEQGRQCLGQLGDGELLLLAEGRTDRTQSLPHPRCRPRRRVRLHRALLQSATAPFKARISKPHGFRGPSYANLTHCPPNRQQVTRENGILRLTLLTLVLTLQLFIVFLKKTDPWKVQSFEDSHFNDLQYRSSEIVIFLRTTISVLAFLAGPALADCPTQEDLAHGIFITYDDGSYSRLTRYGQGSLFEDINYTDGSDRFASVLEGGILVSQSFDIVNGSIPARSIVKTSFSGGSADADSIDAGQDRLLEYTTTDISGMSSGTVLIEKSDSTTVEIGACSTTAFPITTTESRDRGDFITRYFWLPELGVPILRQTENTSDGSRYSVRATKIETGFPITR